MNDHNPNDEYVPLSLLKGLNLKIRSGEALRKMDFTKVLPYAIDNGFRIIHENDKAYWLSHAEVEMAVPKQNGMGDHAISAQLALEAMSEALHTSEIELYLFFAHDENR